MFERTLNRLLLLVSKVLCNKFFLGIVFEASYCHFLIAYLISFLQTQGPHIFQLAPSSNYFDCKAMAIGARSQVILFRHFSLRRLMFSKAPLESVIYEFAFFQFALGVSEVFCKRVVLRNFTKFTRKNLCQSLFFNKVAGLRQNTSGGCL